MYYGYVCVGCYFRRRVKKDVGNECFFFPLSFWGNLDKGEQLLLLLLLLLLLIPTLQDGSPNGIGELRSKWVAMQLHIIACGFPTAATSQRQLGTQSR